MKTESLLIYPTHGPDELKLIRPGSHSEQGF